jgi:hypothetical protein
MLIQSPSYAFSLNKDYAPKGFNFNLKHQNTPQSMETFYFRNKCKFSHDLSVQQKTAKRNLYVDSRELDGNKEG